MAFVDPVRLRELGQAAREASEGVEKQNSEVAERVEKLFLTDFAPMMNHICAELVEELSQFAIVAAQKADDIEIVANGGTPVDTDLTADEFQRLEDSLNDEVGSKGLDGSEDPDLSPEALEQWRKDHPNPSPKDIREKMDQAAAAGNAAAMKYLSNVLWQTIDGLSADKATDYLYELGPLSFIAAVKSTGAPTSLPVATYMAAIAAGTAPALGSADMADYLKQRHALVWADTKQWATDVLEKMSHLGSDEAKIVLLGIDRMTKRNRGWYDTGGVYQVTPLAELARRIALNNPDVLADIVQGPDPAWAQRLIDIMAADAHGPERERIQKMLLNIQAALLEYCEALSKSSPEKGSVAFAQYYRLMQATGHRIGIDLGAALKIILKAADKKWTKGMLAFLIDAGGIVLTDEVVDDRDVETNQRHQQYDASLLVLMQRNPEYAKKVLESLGDPPDWDLLPQDSTDPALKEFYKIRDSMGPVFPPPSPKK